MCHASMVQYTRAYASMRGSVRTEDANRRHHGTCVQLERQSYARVIHGLHASVYIDLANSRQGASAGSARFRTFQISDFAHPRPPLPPCNYLSLGRRQMEDSPIDNQQLWKTLFKLYARDKSGFADEADTIAAMVSMGQAPEEARRMLALRFALVNHLHGDEPMGSGHQKMQALVASDVAQVR